MDADGGRPQRLKLPLTLIQNGSPFSEDHVFGQSYNLGDREFTTRGLDRWRSGQFVSKSHLVTTTPRSTVAKCFLDTYF